MAELRKTQKQRRVVNKKLIIVAAIALSAVIYPTVSFAACNLLGTVVGVQGSGTANPNNFVYCKEVRGNFPNTFQSFVYWSCPGFVEGYAFGRAGGSMLLS